MALIEGADGSRINPSQFRSPPPSPERSRPAPAERAANLVESHTTSHVQGGHGSRGKTIEERTVYTVHTDRLSYDILAIARTDPDYAQDVREEVEARLTPAQLGHFNEDLNRAIAEQGAAFASLAGDRLSGEVIVDEAVAETSAAHLIDDNIGVQVSRRGRDRTEVLNVNELAYDLAHIAESDPAGAVATKLVLDRELTAEQVGELNRLLGGGATWDENVTLALNHPGQGVIGGAKAVANGFSDLYEITNDSLNWWLTSPSRLIAGGLDAAGADGSAEWVRGTYSGVDAYIASDSIPTFDMTNRAQAGGAVIAQAVEIAAGGYGIAKGGIKFLARNGDEIAEVVLRSADDIPASAADDLAEGGGRLVDDAAEIVTQTTRRANGNEVVYTVNAEGQTIRAEATLSNVTTGAVRSPDEIAATRRVGQAGIEGDQGGHIVAHRFMPDQGDINLFPQNANFNTSAYKRFENEIADWINAGAEVRVRIDLDDFRSGRPNDVHVEYEVINPGTGDIVYENSAMFDNVAGQGFDRVARSDIDMLMDN